MTMQPLQAQAMAELAAPLNLVPAPADETPTNSLVSPLLTDMYQVTMAYAYWKAGRHMEHTVFDTFFRKCPFRGEFTLFAGLEEVLRLVQSFRFLPADLEYIRSHPSFADADPEFFTSYLGVVDCSEVQIFAVKEGGVVFPRIPLVRLEGPLGICQLLETTILNLVNFPSLIATNAARHRRVAGPGKTLLEFGLRRAQGPDGGMTASRYSYIGGFDGTSNVAAGKRFGIAVSGTHAHSLVTSYFSLSEITNHTLLSATGERHDFLALCLKYRDSLGYTGTGTNDGELAAFIAYAQAFPKTFLALVDTYETLKSGVPNFVCVGLALLELGYQPLGIRLDSGDLAYLSLAARAIFEEVDGFGLNPFSFAASCKIVASNDINEAVLVSLNEQGHSIDTFGIGTNLVTCQAQPALGMVYKLVEINGRPRIKLSQEVSKVTLPAKKQVYRLVGRDGGPLADLLCRESGDAVPVPGEPYLCRHPSDDTKQVRVKPSAVIPLLHRVWVGARYAAYCLSRGLEPDVTALTPAQAAAGVNLRYRFPSLSEVRAYSKLQLLALRDDHKRPLNPTPYKVSVSADFYKSVKELRELEVPVPSLE